jgi:hypothetical protein
LKGWRKTRPTFVCRLDTGEITHIDLHIKTDFDAHILKIESDYQLAGPVSGSLFLDTAKIELESAQANGQ